MNTNDFTPFPTSLQGIFNLQRDLKFKFEPKAKLDFESFDIDTFESQEVIKKYAWRITEELTEMLEAYYHDAKEGEKEHTYEEAIDAFNFFIELLLLVGHTPASGGSFPMPEDRQFHGVEPDVEDCATQIVYRLGLFCNLLKSREWRRSQYLVDVYLLIPRLERIWGCFMDLFHTFGWDSRTLLDWYTLKYQVNKFRIESEY